MALDVFLNELLQVLAEQTLTYSLKLARPSIFVGTLSISESLRLKQICLYCKTIITHVLHIY